MLTFYVEKHFIQLAIIYYYSFNVQVINKQEFCMGDNQAMQQFGENLRGELLVAAVNALTL